MPQHPPAVGDEGLQHWINRVRRLERSVQDPSFDVIYPLVTDQSHDKSTINGGFN